MKTIIKEEFFNDLTELLKKHGVYFEENESNYADYVQIGGTKWATKNLGAENPTDVGLYFQWGSTEGYEAANGEVLGNKKFYVEQCKFFDDGMATKYNFIDGKTVLQPTDDAATVILGPEWRMPKKDDFKRLIKATNSEWVENYEGSGVNGRLFIDNEDKNKKLFFPAAGSCIGGNIYSVGSCGLYWLNLRNYSTVCYAHHVMFNSSNTDFNDCFFRWMGFSVRPVMIA